LAFIWTLLCALGFAGAAEVAGWTAVATGTELEVAVATLGRSGKALSQNHYTSGGQDPPHCLPPSTALVAA
jgi:hypothetical protein